MNRLLRSLNSATGWLAYTTILLALASLLPKTVLTPGSRNFILLIGVVGMWRYSIGILHYIRGILFLYLVFPRHRRRARKLGPAGAPSRLYLLVTSFRIEAATTAMVYGSVIDEAVACGYPAVVVASIVELADEMLVRTLWRSKAPPPRVRLVVVRIAGTGKRDGLAYGFRAISRDLPDDDAVVAVVDGDTVLDPGVVRRAVPYFRLFPSVGALTTNEFCRVRGSFLMDQWHRLRFAQRQIAMCSMALSRRVLTMTGRMSMFRAAVVTDPGFIDDVENDALDHWRLGHFRFLTGDDKSSWFSLMRLGWDTYYVPDASVTTVEHPPDPRFIAASRQLMFRWYGNSLRQNSRALKLGVHRLGFFASYVLLDQRVSMWTSLLAPIIAVLASIRYSAVYFLIYLLWIGATRLLLVLLLVASGHRIGPAFPVLLYYNQIFGSLMKIYVFFRLDRQSWTRQKTRLVTGTSGFRPWFNRWSSRALTFAASSVFVFLLINLV
ncbi:MAG TPA: glycosyltransferase family 2 protein [Desulfobulbus sp.]|nr:glycosyltransferase family 2 protein [Desulfobulbus sp.]